MPAPSVASIDPASRRSKKAYNSLVSSAVGAELGVSVVIGTFFGRWLDGQVGSDPWLMILFLALGFVAGIRGILRSARRAERAIEREALDGHA